MSALKSLSIDIGAEVREHNRLLKDVDDDFDSTSGKIKILDIHTSLIVDVITELICTLILT